MDAKELLDSLDVGCAGDGARLDDRRMVRGGGAHHRAAGGPRAGSEHLGCFPGGEGHRARTRAGRGTGRREAAHLPRARRGARGRGHRPGNAGQPRPRGINSPSPSGRCRSSSRPSRGRRKLSERARGRAPAVSAIVSSLPTPALVLAPDGQILDANPRAQNCWVGGLPPALRGRSLAEWAPASEQGQLAAALRHAVTRRQDVALSFESAGEAGAGGTRRHRQRGPGARGTQARVPGPGRVARDPVATAAAPGRPTVAAGALVSGVAHELNIRWRPSPPSGKRSRSTRIRPTWRRAPR